MKLPPLNALRAFEAAARLQSFSRAGDELHVTHAAVSHQIKQLEEWFGCALFYRRGRGVQLTKVGQLLSSGISRSFTDIADLCQRLRVARGNAGISVGCIPSIATRWLVPNLSNFSQHHPQIDLQVQYATPEERLDGYEYDVLITLGSDPSPSTKSTRLFSRISRPVCSPGYLARQGALTSPAQILHADLLHDESREAWRSWGQAAGLREAMPLAGPVYQDFNLLVIAAIAGHGVALCPVDVFREEIARGDLLVLSDQAVYSDDGYFLITRGDLGRAEREFVDWFTQVVRSRDEVPPLETPVARRA